MATSLENRGARPFETTGAFGERKGKTMVPDGRTLNPQSLESRDSFLNTYFHSMENNPQSYAGTKHLDRRQTQNWPGTYAPTPDCHGNMLARNCRSSLPTMRSR